MAEIFSWDSFIRIHGGIVGARDCFEQVCAELLYKELSGKDVHRIDSSNEDGGIDIYVSNDDNTVDIYQCKFFIDRLDSPKWTQIKNSFNTLIAAHSGLHVKIWYLCLPKLLSSRELEKYENFKTSMRSEEIAIRLIDGENLISRISAAGLTDKWFKSGEERHESTKYMIPIYLSHPRPHTKLQKKFVTLLKRDLKRRGFYPRTMGESEYSMSAPLTAMSRVIVETQGCLCVAFRRIYIEKAIDRKGANLPGERERYKEQYWYTSPYSQIEPAMAYQMKLPILILKEKDVCSEGMLEVSNQAPYIPEFELSPEEVMEDYFESDQYIQLIEGFWQKTMNTIKPIQREQSLASFLGNW